MEKKKTQHTGNEAQYGLARINKSTQLDVTDRGVRGHAGGLLSVDPRCGCAKPSLGGQSKPFVLVVWCIPV